MIVADAAVLFISSMFTHKMESLVSHIMSNAASRVSFSVKDLMQDAFIINLETSEAVVKSTVSRLVKKRKIARIGRGIYCLSGKNVFSPVPGILAVNLYKQLQSSFPFVKLCVYEGQWIAPLLHHLASNQMLYIEAEKDATETVYHFLQNQNLKLPVYYEPDIVIMDRYVNMNEPGIIMKSLISEAPTIEAGDIRISSLEKLLVDIYADPDFFYLQGGEYFYIMDNAQSLYHINQSTLLRYASRRGIKEELEKIIASTK